MSPSKTSGTGKPQPAETLNIKGMKCPAPLSWATTILDGLKPGDILEILATDSSAIENFEAFSKATGNELMGWSEEGGVYRILLRKSA